MFAKIKNRKRALVYILLIVALIAAGITYAWFTAEAPLNGEVRLGELGIDGVFAVETEGVLYEPGLYEDIKGTVKNTGSLDLIAKLELGVETTLSTGETRSPDPNIDFDYSVIDMDSVIDDAGKGYIWLQDPTTNEYYLLLTPGIELDLEFGTIVLDGPGMGNEYMNAVISLVNSWEATQVIDEAVDLKWGVDLGVLFQNVVYKNNGGRSFYAASQNSNVANVTEYLEKLLNR